MKPQVKEWIKKAEEDWQAAQRLIKGKRPLYNLVCFHAQQCSEKYIKAFIESKEKSVPRTHDLVALINSDQPELDELILKKDELEKLTAYAVAFRYPGENATKKQAKDSLEIVKFIRATIRAKMMIFDRNYL